MENDKEQQATLSSGDRKLLRGLGHHLPVTVTIGREGISTALLAALEDDIRAHELVKVKLGQNCPVEKKEAARQLSEAAQAIVIQRIGKTLLLFRANPDLPTGQRAIHHLRKQQKNKKLKSGRRG